MSLKTGSGTQSGNIAPTRESVTQGIVSAIMLSCLMSSPAFAATLDPIQNIVNEIVTALTGPLGIAIGTLIIAGTGLGAAMGRLEWRTFFMAFIGLVMVYGAATIVAGIVATAGTGGGTPPAPVNP